VAPLSRRCRGVGARDILVGMKHVTFADKTLFLDDEAADCLVEYAGVLGATNSADTVRLRAIGGDGNEVEADFVLNAATNLMSESTNSSLRPPTNDEAVDYMRSRMSALRHAPTGHSIDVTSDGDQRGEWDLV
jgi:hypothetical protein